MAIGFHIEDEPVDGVTHLVVVTGEIDLFTAPELKSRLSAPIDDGKTRIIVDLSAVTFIDSSSLGVLIGAHKQLKESGSGLVIVCDDRTIMNTFKITGLNGVFEIVARRADALASS
jgi:anti-sigma B factor antagonist